jgi:hypothetical protein
LLLQLYVDDKLRLNDHLAEVNMMIGDSAVDVVSGDCKLVANRKGRYFVTQCTSIRPLLSACPPVWCPPSLFVLQHYDANTAIAVISFLVDSWDASKQQLERICSQKVSATRASSVYISCMWSGRQDGVSVTIISRYIITYICAFMHLLGHYIQKHYDNHNLLITTL